MKLFITGASGFLGRQCVAYLCGLPQGHGIDELVCLVRDQEKAAFLKTLKPAFKLTILQGDLLDPASYDAAAVSATVVFHLAGLVGLKNGAAFYTQNYQATQQLVSVLQNSTVLQRLVLMSSIAAVDHDKRQWSNTHFEPLTEASPCTPTTDYGGSKYQAEQAVMASGLPYTIIRPAYIIGPHLRAGSSTEKLLLALKQQVSWTRFPFPGRVSWIRAWDLAAVTWQVSQHPETLNHCYFAAYQNPIAISNALAMLAAELQVPFSPRVLSTERVAKWQAWYFARQPENPVLRILYTNYFECNPQALQQLMPLTTPITVPMLTSPLHLCPN